MAKWWKRWGLLAGGLLGVGSLADSASAQFPTPPGGGYGAPSGGIFTGLPQSGPPAPASLNPSMANMLTNDGTPNAFLDDQRPPGPAEPYVLTFRMEYLTYHISRGKLAVPLVTSSTAPNILDNFGALGQANTVTLLDKGDYKYGFLDGARFTLGMAPPWCVPFEVSAFGFRRSLNIFNQTSDGSAGSTLLARPVQLVDPANLVPGGGTESAFIVGFPDDGTVSAQGSMSVRSTARFWQIDASFFSNFFESDALLLDCIVGYQHNDFTETLEIRNTLGPAALVNFNTNIGLGPGFTTTVFDQFRTTNRFDGGVIGLRSVLTNRRISLITDAKVGIGNMRQTLRINGESNLIQPVVDRPVTTLPGGILALESNSGIISQDRFTFVPQLKSEVSFQLTNHLRVFGGYNVLYWANVARPGSHLNNVIDPRQAPTHANFTGELGTNPVRPTIDRTGFFAHGFNIGLEVGF